MTYLVAFIVCFIAGIGAGLGTGFAGMSAAAVISPMLITFLGKMCIRDRADRIGRSVTGRGPQARAKADGKFLDMDTAMARRHKVAQLMHQNDAAKHEQRCQPGQQCSHRHLTSKVLDVEL